MRRSRPGSTAAPTRSRSTSGCTRDGRVVLLHDTTLDRTTTGPGSAASARIGAGSATLDAGSWFSRRFAGEPPIDLDDALAIVRPHVPLIVEIKPIGRERPNGIDPADRATVDGVLAAFERTGRLPRRHDVVFAGWTLLAHAAQRAPRPRSRADGRLEGDAATRSRGRSESARRRSTRTGGCARPRSSRAREAWAFSSSPTPSTAPRSSPRCLRRASTACSPTTRLRCGVSLSRRTAAPALRQGALTLGIDQGSGGTRAVLIDANDAIVAAHATRVASRRDKDGAIVQDAEAVAGVGRRRRRGRSCASPALRITAAGLAVQRSSLVVWRAPRWQAGDAGALLAHGNAGHDSGVRPRRRGESSTGRPA